MTISALLLLTLSGNTQTRKNSVAINFGISSGYGYPNVVHQNSSIPALNLSGDYSLNKLFSMGVYGSYAYTFHESHTPPEMDYKDVWKGWDMGIRSSFHFSPLILKNQNIDLYLAAFFGYTVHYLLYDKKNIYRYNFKYKVDDINAGSIAGFRYYISKVVGVYAEAGLARKLFISGGVSFRINSK